MFGKIIAAVALGTGIAFFSPQAEAAGPASFARSFGAAPLATVHMAKTDRVQRCEIVAGRCAENPALVPVAVAEARREELRQVNNTVNETFGALDDYLGEVAGSLFPVTADAGACGDCAAAKRLELISLGWQPDALRVAWELSDNGSMEKVLIIETGAGMIVLDNDRPVAAAAEIESIAL